MNRLPRPLLALCACGLVVVLLLLSAPSSLARVGPPDAPAPTQGSSTWAQVGYDSGGTRYNAVEQDVLPPLGREPSRIIRFSEYETLADLARQVLVVDNQIFFLDGSSLLALARETGSEQWRYRPTEEQFLTLRNMAGVVDERVLVSGFVPAGQTPTNPPFPLFEQEMTALDTVTGAVVWRHPENGFGTSVLDGSTLYVLWQEEVDDEEIDYISALRVSDGQTLWRQEVDFPGSVSVPVVANNRLFFAVGNDVIAYDTATGTQLWAYEDTANSSTLEPTIAAVGDRLLLSQGDRILALDATAGTPLWTDEVRDGTECFSDDTGLATDGNLVALVGVCRETIVAYSVATGVRFWEYTAPERYFIDGGQTFAGANGVLFLAAITNNRFQSTILSFDFDDGTLLQERELPQGGFLSTLGVGSGQVYGAGNALFFYGEGLNDDPYLRSYDNDGVALTNPTRDEPIPLTDRDGDFGAEVSIAARIGNEPATLTVYDANDAVYKSATAQPDRFGNGYWVVPLEYAAAGYSYEVELAAGEILARREIGMPADPTSNLAAIVDLDGGEWQNPPTTLTEFPATLSLQLPSDFPSGDTETALVLQGIEQDGEPVQGALLLEGQRSGNQVTFALNRSNVVSGTFLATAIAQSGINTTYSPDITLTLAAPGLPRTAVTQIGALGTDRNGRTFGTAYQFERQRPVVSPDQADVQVAAITPDPAGFLVDLRVDLPAVPTNPGDQWEIGVRGLDADGEIVDEQTTTIDTATDTRFAQVALQQTGANPIVSFQAIERFVPAASTGLSLAQAGSYSITDVIDINGQVGLSGSATAGVGVAAQGYVQGSLLTGKTTACIEGGATTGAGIGGGPSAAVNLGLTMRGPNHAAPATSGTKYYGTLSGGLGLEISYTKPDNFGEGGYGQIGLGLSLAPQAEANVGVSRVECLPDDPPPPRRPNPDRPRCRSGSCRQPPPPGGDHPDDTHSVVLSNLANEITTGPNYWSALAVQARAAGYNELVSYANYQVRLTDYLLRIADLPVNEPLTEPQQDVLDGYQYFRTEQAFLLQRQQPAALAQLRLLERGQASVVANGYYREMLSMLNRYRLPAGLVDVDFSPDELGTGLLIIPTSGLYGLADVPAFGARLTRFVEQGGTLLVMAQPDDDSLDVLPGSNLQQVGYNNDISCFRDAMTLETPHPMLASLSAPTITSHVDGFLTSLPDAATLLLRRTKNDQGAFALYGFGSGQIIVTNMYDDWGRTTGQSSPQVRDLFRDILRWASQPGELPDTRPGQPISVPLDVANQTTSDATQVRYIVRTPDGITDTLDTAVQPLALAAGATGNVNASFTPASTDLGIWQLNYALLDSEGSVIQFETGGALFTVSNPPVLAAAAQASAPAAALAQAPVTSPPPPAEVQATLDETSYRPTDQVGLTLDITLPQPAEVGSLRVTVSLGETTEEQVVTPQASQQLAFNLPADFSGNGLLFYGLYDDTTGQGLYLDTLWVTPQGGTTTITTDQPSYAPGDTVALRIDSQIDRTLLIDAPGLLLENTIPEGISTGSFELPSPLASGPYEIQYTDGSVLRSTRFDVRGPQFVIERISTPDPQSASGRTLPVSLTLRSDTEIDTLLLADLVEPSGSSSRVIEQAQRVVSGTQVISLSVPFAVTSSGVARLDIALVDAANPAVEYSRSARRIGTEAAQLMAVRTAEAALDEDADGSLLLDWYSPTAQTVTVTVRLDDNAISTETQALAAGFSGTTVAVPPGTPAGSYTVQAEARSGGLVSRAQAVLVVQGDVVVYLPRVVR